MNNLCLSRRGIASALAIILGIPLIQGLLGYFYPSPSHVAIIAVYIFIFMIAPPLALLGFGLGVRQPLPAFLLGLSLGFCQYLLISLFSHLGLHEQTSPSYFYQFVSYGLACGVIGAAGAISRWWSVWGAALICLGIILWLASILSRFD